MFHAIISISIAAVTMTTSRDEIVCIHQRRQLIIRQKRGLIIDAELFIIRCKALSHRISGAVQSLEYIRGIIGLLVLTVQYMQLILDKTGSGGAASISVRIRVIRVRRMTCGRRRSSR